MAWNIVKIGCLLLGSEDVDRETAERYFKSYCDHYPNLTFCLVEVRAIGDDQQIIIAQGTSTIQ